MKAPEREREKDCPFIIRDLNFSSKWDTNASYYRQSHYFNALHTSIDSLLHARGMCQKYFDNKSQTMHCCPFWQLYFSGARIHLSTLARQQLQWMRTAIYRIGNYNRTTTGEAWLAWLEWNLNNRIVIHRSEITNREKFHLERYGLTYRETILGEEVVEE